MRGALTAPGVEVGPVLRCDVSRGQAHHPRDGFLMERVIIRLRARPHLPASALPRITGGVHVSEEQCATGRIAPLFGGTDAFQLTSPSGEQAGARLNDETFCSKLFYIVISWGSRSNGWIMAHVL